jgi:flagellar biosynthetic protein FlhB
MAESEAGERTEQPTARRMSEARDEGRVARSSDLTAAVGLLAGLVLLNSFGPDLLELMLSLTQTVGTPGDIRAETLPQWLATIAVAAGAAMLPFLAFLMVVTVTGALAQSGVLVTWKKLRPKLSELSPAKGLKRILSTDSLTRLGLGLLKLALLSLVAWWSAAGLIDAVLGAGGLAARGVLSLGAHVVFTIAIRLALMLLVLGLLDYFYQRWSLNRSLMMTKQEVKEELKRMEGDPLMKQRRRQVQARLALQRIGIDVPKADVVVTNPTEFAVALTYDEATMQAPRVLAKGKDFLALRIRQVAQQHGVPVVQRPPLARALYAAVEVGGEVPATYYKAVAELLAFVYQLEGRARARAG